jgi:hypothetical protein
MTPVSGLTPGASSPALNRGDATAGHYPSTDYAGAVRFCGSAPEAGAVERCP